MIRTPRPCRRSGATAAFLIFCLTVLLALPATVRSELEPEAPSPPVTQIDSRLEQARTALAAGRVAEAERVLRAALAENPEQPSSWYLLGGALQQLGRIEEAVAAYDRALALRDDLPAPWFERGLALASLGRYSDAESSFERCLELVPDEPQVALNLGIVRIGLGDAAGALAPLEQAAGGHNPQVAVGHLSTALRSLGRQEEAIARAREALASAPEYAPLRYELALGLAETGAAEAALTELETAASIEPPYIPAVVALGRELAALPEQDAAIRATGLFWRVLAAEPGNAVTWAELAQLYVRLGLQSDASEASSRAIELGVGDAEALVTAGNALLHIGNASQALLALDAAASETLDDAWIHHHRGLALTELQRFDEALDAYRTALSLEPELVEAAVQAARAALATGDEATALEFLEPAFALAPDDPNLLALLGKAYLNSGETERAIEPLREAVRLDSLLPEPPYLLARAYRTLGQAEAADLALADFQSRSAAEQTRRQAGRDSRRIEAFLIRAAVYTEEGRFTEALEVLDRARRQHPDEPRVYDLLATAYERAGEPQRAAEAAATAARLRRPPR